MLFFSIIIPLYNRPQEIRELLMSMTQQRYPHFEIIIVEDGSTMDAAEVVSTFEDLLDLKYFVKENEGQGFARNYGFARAKGDYFIVFDSDILVPEDYLEKVVAGLARDHWDAFGGPDAAHDSFSATQKAISYSMTSPFTTGGIRGNKKHVGVFHPRSFNLGISRQVYEQTQGFHLSRRSEDIEFSIRMIQQGFKVGLIPEAFVYHKRRATLKQFFQQTHNFGIGRIEIAQRYPAELKAVHALPALFFMAVLTLALLLVYNFLTFGEVAWVRNLAVLGCLLLSSYTLLLALHAFWSTKSLKVAMLSVAAAYTQFFAYGSGFLKTFLTVKLGKVK